MARQGIRSRVAGVAVSVATISSALAVEYVSSERQPAGPVDGSWDRVAASSDGATLIVGDYDGRLYTSTDAGGAWAERRLAGDTNLFWSAVATSGDGQVMLAGSAWNPLAIVPQAAGPNALQAAMRGRLFASANGGQNWIEERPAGDTDLEWTGLACSTDGSTVLAGVGGNYGGRLYVQRGGPGNSWLEVQPAGATNYYWDTVACSGDGSVMLAASTWQRIYLSHDSGVTWNEVQPVGPQGEGWQAAAMSALGQHIYAGTGIDGGRLYGSSDGGGTWGELQPAGDVDQEWTALGCSGNGRYVVAAGPYGRAYVSDDAGQSWGETQPAGDTNRMWRAAALSQDGRRVVLTESPGRIYGGTAIVGRVRCRIAPARAVARDATWRLTSGADIEWHVSGEMSGWVALDRNAYTVVFSSISDYARPNSVGVTVSNNATTVVEGRYLPVNMSNIGGTTFAMGLYRGQGAHSVTLDDFMLDYAEVTVADYEEFCQGTGQNMPLPPPWGWTNTALPMVNVTWNDAAAFAAWAGKRLPTEAEFEYAMRSGVADQLYPWGDSISSEDANYDEAGIGQPAEAGMFGGNAYDLSDIAGNVNEWCYDWHEDLLTGPVTNPVGPASGTYKTSRSGSWANRARQLRCSSRIYRAPSARYIDLGFRCAAEPSFIGEQSFEAVPTWWVLSHFGLEVGGPGGTFDEAKDSDDDGVADAAEYYAGTDPADGASVLSITRVIALPDGAGRVVEWSSELGRVYTLERSTDLAAGYTPVAGNLVATPPLNSYTDQTALDGPVFYRVRLPQ